MSIATHRTNLALANAWILWSQKASPLYDPEKALRLWDRSGERIADQLVRMGLRGLLPEDTEI